MPKMIISKRNGNDIKSMRLLSRRISSSSSSAASSPSSLYRADRVPLLVLLLLQVLSLLVSPASADLTPFFDPKKQNDGGDNASLPRDVFSSPTYRRLNELKAQALHRRRMEQDPSVDSYDVVTEPNRPLRGVGPTRGDGNRWNGPDDVSDSDDYDADGTKGSKKGNNNNKDNNSKKKGDKKGSKSGSTKKTGKYVVKRSPKKSRDTSSSSDSKQSKQSKKGESPSSPDSDDGDSVDRDEDEYDGDERDSGDGGSGGGGEGGGGDDHDSDDNDEPPSASLEVALLRYVIGSPDDEDSFGLASSIALNGEVFPVTYDEHGFRDIDNDPDDPDDAIGVFKAVCTVVSIIDDELLCTYEIAFRTDSGEAGLGAVIARGPIQGAASTALITGAEYDFAQFSGGTLTTLQDPDRPILFAYLDLQ